MVAGLVLVAGAAMADDIGHTVTDLPAYEARVDQMSDQYHAILVGIRADWCAFCQVIEADILPALVAGGHLRDIGLIKVDVTAADEDVAEILTHLAAWGPPTYFVIDGHGQELPDSRMIGPFTVDDMAKRLARARLDQGQPHAARAQQQHDRPGRRAEADRCAPFMPRTLQGRRGDTVWRHCAVGFNPAPVIACRRWLAPRNGASRDTHYCMQASSVVCPSGRKAGI